MAASMIVLLLPPSAFYQEGEKEKITFIAKNNYRPQGDPRSYDTSLASGTPHGLHYIYTISRTSVTLYSTGDWDPH